MVATLVLLLLPTAMPTADVAVVCPAEFRAELTPWLEHRARQGHRVAFVESSGSAETIRSRVQEVARGGALKYVLLVGDAPASNSADVIVSDREVPTHLARAKVNIRWGSEPEIATDHFYADLDGDQLPDVAVGRLPADSPADLRRMIQKILAYERSGNFGEWRRRVNFVAGLGGFGALADAALEAAAKKLLTDGIPASYATSMTYGSWRSPYCPDPREFRSVTLDRLNEGCLFWIYIGHGHRRQVDFVRVPGAMFPIFSDRDVPQLRAQTGPPIACFLACYAGAFDHAQDCLAEEMLRAPGGPIAVYAGSRVTMPYAMAVMGMAMIDTCFGEDPAPTLGDAVRLAKRRMMADDNPNPNRRALDSLAALVSPAPVDLIAERAEHMNLFNLLGDPLLRLPQPHHVELNVPDSITAGDSLPIELASDLDGSATVELVVRRDRLTFSPDARPEFQPNGIFLSRFNEVYAHANDPRLAATNVSVRNGKATTTLRVPDTAKGECHLRVFIEGRDACALGSCDIELKPPAKN